jgi:putative ABC transport system permease protein
MNALRELFRRLRHLMDRGQAESDLAEEMRLHIEMRAAEHVNEGSSPSEARMAAQRQFGNVTRMREQGRDAWGWSWLDSLGQDLRYGVRALITHKAFTITALVSLALGVGANTAVFSIMNAVMLRSLPVQAPHRLVQLLLDGNDTLTNPLWESIRDAQNACSGTLAYSAARFDLAEQGEKRLTQGVWVSGDYFNVLGISPFLGRLITRDDDQPGGGRSGPAAVISYRFWQSHFGSDPGVIGRTIRLDRALFQIVGIAPPDFSGLEIDAPFSVAIPIACDPILRPDHSLLKDRSAWWLRILGRLEGEVTPEQATARLAAIAPQILQRSLPLDWDASGQKGFLNQKFGVQSAVHGFSGMGREHRTSLFASMTVVACVLLIACANIANLLLARATARQQEIAVRLAIGASRARVMRQLLTESILLALLGLPGGLLLAKWGAKLLVGLVSNPRRTFDLDLSMDLRVLGFTAGIALLTGLLFGLAPALRATRVSTHDVLKPGARGSIGGGTRFHLGKALVAGQVALSLALLVAAGLLLATFRNLLNEPLGFAQQNVLTIRADTLGQVPKEQRVALFTDLVERARQTPGVISAASAFITPLSGLGWNGNLLPLGQTASNRKDRTHLTWFNRVSPEYFSTLRTPLVMGRDFNDRDSLGSPKVIILGEKTARECFGEANPIGQIVSRDGQDSYEVVGVVKDTKYRNVQEEHRRTAFMPLAQDNEPAPATTLMVRGLAAPTALIPTLRTVIMHAHPTLSLEFRPLDLQVRETFRTQRLIAMTSAIFGVLALSLAIVGLYGVTSYAVGRRQGEIGLRMALGARRSAVLWLVLRDVTVILGFGALFGIAISLSGVRYLSSIIYGLNPTAPAIFVTAVVILSAAGLLAGLFPALRASRIEPAVALRHE